MVRKKCEERMADQEFKKRGMEKNLKSLRNLRSLKSLRRMADQEFKKCGE